MRGPARSGLPRKVARGPHEHDDSGEAPGNAVPVSSGSPPDRGISLPVRVAPAAHQHPRRWGGAGCGCTRRRPPRRFGARPAPPHRDGARRRHGAVWGASTTSSVARWTQPFAFRVSAAPIGRSGASADRRVLAPPPTYLCMLRASAPTSLRSPRRSSDGGRSRRPPAVCRARTPPTPRIPQARVERWRSDG